MKENVVPTHAAKVLFILAPIATLILSFLGWAIVPLGQGLTLFDFNLGILYTLALSSLGVTGFLYLALNIKKKTQGNKSSLELSFNNTVNKQIFIKKIAFANANLKQGYQLRKFSNCASNFVREEDFNLQCVIKKIEEIEFAHWFSGFKFFNIKILSTLASHRSFLNNNNLNLVLWGSNLESQVGKGRFLKNVYNRIYLPSYQYSIIAGLILSDGWLSIPNKHSINARLGFKQSLNHFDYVFFVLPNYLIIAIVCLI